MVNAMNINMVATKLPKIIPPYKLSILNLHFSKLLTSPIHSNLSTSSSSLVYNNNAKFKFSNTICACALGTPKILSENQETEVEEFQEKFEWYAEWYPVVHVCDLDDSGPLRRRVMGFDIVVWWESDKVEKDWKVFEDKPKDAPLQDHDSKKASVAVYPSCVQNDILWFWPDTDPQFEGILLEKRPPEIPEIAGLPASKLNYSRDLPYGYEVLIQNLMDPAHIPYVHYNIMGSFLSHESVKADKEGGKPLEMNVKELSINGFKAKLEFEGSVGIFSPPCLFYISTNHTKTPIGHSNDVQSSHDTQKRYLMIFYCIPVSPGYSRLIVTTRRNFALWLDPVVPLWIFHQELNLVLDSDLYLIHMEELLTDDKLFTCVGA
ncbi:hypothetical protein Leryth_000478 [Lithospermum erythrorhizon]|nr:hypothetical protein Leryth_000478 [Lithospermum erythrorhizon]